MSEWQKNRLGDFVEITNGFAFKSENFLAERTTKSLPVIKIRNVANGDVHLNDCLFHEYNESLSKYLVSKNDILIALTGNHPETMTQVVGEASRYKFEEKALLNQRVAKIKAKENFNNDFLYYFLKDEVTHDLLASQSAGSANQANISKENIENLSIVCPSIPEQRAIASILSSLDDKIDLLHRQNKTLEQLAETLFRQWFVEEADESWEVRKFGDLISESIGGDWGDETAFEGSVPIICLRGVDLHNIKEFGFANEAPIRFISTSSLAKRTLSENDVLLAGSGIGPIGKSLPINFGMFNNYHYPVIYSNFCKRLQAESKAIAYFIEFSIYQLYKMGELDQFHSGTSIPNFNLKDFLNYDIVVPPIEKIKKFSNFLDYCYNKKYSKQIRILTQLRDTLLPKLMSGEVRVK